MTSSTAALRCDIGILWLLPCAPRFTTNSEQVITNHDELSRMQTQTEQAAFVLLALQAPVAGDLRLVVGSMQNVADAERMGGLALHVAKIARW